MKIKYKLYLIFENMEDAKIIGIKEGKDLYDWISKKHDKILDENLGEIEISGPIHFLKDYIVLDEDCDYEDYED